MAVKTVQIVIAGQKMSNMQRNFLQSSGQIAPYLQDLVNQQMEDERTLNDYLEANWEIIGQGQLDSSAGTYHYFHLYKPDSEVELEEQLKRVGIS